MNTPPPARDLALVGAGYWGKNLARNFNTLGVLNSICDSDTATLSAYGPEYAAVRKRQRLEEILSDSTITKVAIATPAATHGTIVAQALHAGKDVFVEKPLCLDLGDGQSLAEVAEKNGRILMVGHLLQYHPCILRLQGLLSDGSLGKLLYMTSTRLNLGKIRHEENALWSFAPHDISVIVSLAGSCMPETVRCVGGAYLRHGVADTTLTALRFPGGIKAHIYVSWLNPFKEQKLTVIGSDAMAVFDDTLPWPEKLTLYRDYLTWTNGQFPAPSKRSGEPVSVHEAEPLHEECRHFLERCATRKPPKTDGKEGILVLHVLRAAQLSLERDGEAVLPAQIRSHTPGPETGRPATPADYSVHPTAVVEAGASIGKGTRIWHFAHVLPGACIGENCVLGQNVNVDGGARLGSNVKVQNNVSIYSGVTIEDDVFLGPSCVLTNVTNPRSQVTRHKLYERTLLRRGCTIGANATILPSVTIGRYAFVAAGAVVTRDVRDYSLVVGNPARHRGWISRHGHVLGEPDPAGIMTCPESGLRYRLESSTILRCLDLPEDSPLPPMQSVGEYPYHHFKATGERPKEAPPIHLDLSETSGRHGP